MIVTWLSVAYGLGFPNLAQQFVPGPVQHSYLAFKYLQGASTAYPPLRNFFLKSLINFGT